MPAKRGERVTPPAKPGGWDLRYATSDAVKGWEQLCQAARSNTWEAWVILTERPTTPKSPERQHRLRGKALATRKVNGKVLDQWQYEVTSGGRIWYCPDPDERVVWLTDAGPGHPKATE
jgi:hypothetical protein